MPTPVYATLQDLTDRGYDISGYEAQATIFLNDCLTFLRQECIARGFDFDQAVANGTILKDAVILVQVKRTMESIRAMRAIDQWKNTDREGVKQISHAQSANGYSESESITYETSGDVAVFVRDHDLQALGINSQFVGRIKF